MKGSEEHLCCLQNNQTKEEQNVAHDSHESTIVYHATPIQQIPPLDSPHTCDSTTVCFYSISNSFFSSFASDYDNKPQASTSLFHITNMSARKPPLSMKRKCSSVTFGLGYCSGVSSSKCHCSKKRKLRLKRVERMPAISSRMADIEFKG